MRTQGDPLPPPVDPPPLPSNSGRNNNWRQLYPKVGARYDQRVGHTKGPKQLGRAGDVQSLAVLEGWHSGLQGKKFRVHTVRIRSKIFLCDVVKAVRA
ncbi:uncharacterized protein DS421_16g545550 [Arachis hypogaea]|nr:uncharacterized protein DS421_16g545550 [Arachis hypogaea]